MLGPWQILIREGAKMTRSINLWISFLRRRLALGDRRGAGQLRLAEAEAMIAAARDAFAPSEG
nr:hypothetical protein Hi04_10k_c5418_00016 [uncultured bacterium]